MLHTVAIRENQVDWVVKPLIGGKDFRSNSFIGFEKRIQSCCSTQKVHYVKKTYIYKREGNEIVRVLITDASCSLPQIEYGFR